MTYVPPPPAASPQGYGVQPGAPRHGYGVPPGTPPLGYPQPGLPPPGWYRPGLPLSPSGAPLASFLDRFLAYLIDGAIAAGVAVVCIFPAFFALMYDQLSELETQPDGSVTGMGEYVGRTLLMYAVVLGFSLVLSYVYWVELMFRSGQTVGKRVMKIRVVPLDPAAGRLTRAMATKRWLVFNVAAIVPGFVYLDGLWQLWDKPYQQCLHDKFATTVVVKLPAG